MHDNSDLRELHDYLVNEGLINSDDPPIRGALDVIRQLRELPVSKDWMETITGRRFAPLDDEPEYSIYDLVWGCARMCRFAGQISEEHEHYSVAEHLVLLTRWLMAADRDLEPEVAALMPETPEACRRVVRTLVAHDLPEGLLQDMVRPLKRQDPFYRKAEERMSADMARRYDLIHPLPEVVKLIDNRALVDERFQAMNRTGLHWGSIDGMKALGIELQFWSPKQAARELFKLLKELGGFEH